MKKPKRTKPEHVRCPECKKPVHIDDLGMIDKRGFWHKECIFKIYYQDLLGFLLGGEIKTRVRDPKLKRSGGKK